MKKIRAYKTEDGKVVEFRLEAKIHENKDKVLESVTDIARCYFPFQKSLNALNVAEFVVEHYLEIKKAVEG